MNGFRITVLTLLCLSVGLMFYAVLFVIPSWQEDYRIYQSSVRIAEYEKKNDIHKQQMRVYDAGTETPEVQQARMDQEEAARKNEVTLNQAEESNVLAAAKRKEEAARAEAERRQKEAANPVSAVIGVVAAYDENWNSIMIKPKVPEVFVPKTVVAVWRDKMVVCEAVVDALDVQSGQVSATVKEVDFGEGTNIDPAKLRPHAGDEVIVSPFETASELRNEGGEPSQAPLPVNPSGAGAPAELPAVPTEGAHSVPSEPAQAPLPVNPPGADAPAELPLVPTAGGTGGGASLPSLDEEEPHPEN